MPTPTATSVLALDFGAGEAGTTTLGPIGATEAISTTGTGPLTLAWDASFAPLIIVGPETTRAALIIVGAPGALRSAAPVARPIPGPEPSEWVFADDAGDGDGSCVTACGE